MAGLLDFVGVPAGLLGIGGLPFDEQNFRQMQPGGIPPWMATAPMTLPQGQGFGPDEMSGAQRQPGPPMQMAPQLPPQAPAPAMPPAAPQSSGGPGILERLANTGGLIGGIANTLGAVTGQGGSGINPETSNGPAGQVYRLMLSKGVEPQMAKVLASSRETAQAWLTTQVKPQGTDDIREYEYAKAQGFQGTFADWNDRKRAGAGEYGLQPIWGTDDKGNTVMLQAGKSGKAIQSVLPPNVNLSTGVDKIDLGTHWGIQDKRSGEIKGYLPKNIEAKEAAEEVGKARGQAQAELPAVEMTANRTIKQIDDFVGSPGFDEVFGQIDQFRPNWTMSDKGREALTRFKQLSGRAFLEDRAMLKGGGAITDFESNKAEMAVARLERSLNESDAKSALEEFKEAVREGAAKLRAKAGGAAPQPAAPAAPSADLKKKYGLD